MVNSGDPVSAYWGDCLCFFSVRRICQRTELHFGHSRRCVASRSYSGHVGTDDERRTHSRALAEAKLRAELVVTNQSGKRGSSGSDAVSERKRKKSKEKKLQVLVLCCGSRRPLDV